MPSIYFSPSAQEHNIGAGDYGTEERRMNEIADIAIPRLHEHGFTVFRNDRNMTLSQIVADSNAKKADIHFALHSNAGGGKGTVIFYYSGSEGGKHLAQCVYDEVAPLTPSADRGVQPNSTFAEIAKTNSRATLIEVAFHDNIDDANFIINHETEIAEAIVKGLCRYFNVVYKPKEQPVQESGKLFRVQVGAFSIKANAEKLAEELKAKGYSTIII